MVMGCSRVVIVTSTTKLGDSIGLAAEVGLDGLLARGILHGDVESSSLVLVN
jgi:hypothetical protein